MSRHSFPLIVKWLRIEGLWCTETWWAMPWISIEWINCLFKEIILSLKHSTSCDACNILEGNCNVDVVRQDQWYKRYSVCKMLSSLYLFAQTVSYYMLPIKFLLLQYWGTMKVALVGWPYHPSLYRLVDNHNRTYLIFGRILPSSHQSLFCMWSSNLVISTIIVLQ